MENSYPILLGFSLLFVAILLVLTLVFWFRFRRLNTDFVDMSTRFRSEKQKAEDASIARARAEALLQLGQERFSKIISIENEEQAAATRLRGLLDSEAEKTADFQKAHQERLEAGIAIEKQIQIAKDELARLDETLDLQSFGFYQSRYDLETPDEYKHKLDGVKFAQKKLVQGKIAAVCDAEWKINGSKTEGRKHINQMLKLLVRGFTGEADSAIARVKYNNVHVMQSRIEKSYEAFNKMGSYQHCYINADFYALKLEELFLVHEYREKLQQAKEEQREIRAKIREEEVARREIAKALETAQKEEERYTDALEKARLEVATAVGERQGKLLDHIGNLERKLGEALTLKQRAISRAQLTRSGHVYVVSNLGSFGENVYKIGMTRRLDPFDRVLELGDASVPFRFDVHAVIYSEDAPGLETRLHQKFHDRRLNRVNFRKEFFRVSLTEIATAVNEFHGAIEFTELADAEDYRKSLAATVSNLQLPPMEEYASVVVPVGSELDLTENFDDSDDLLELE